MPRTDAPLWTDYKKMVMKIAWKHSRTSGAELDELIGEGMVIFVKACRLHNRRRSTFSTFLWHCLHRGFINYCWQYRRQTRHELTADGELPATHVYDHHKHIERAIFINQSLAMLPANGRQAVRLLLEDPRALGIKGAAAPRAVRSAIRRHLRTTGDSWSVVDRTMKQLKSIYEEAR